MEEGEIKNLTNDLRKYLSSQINKDDDLTYLKQINSLLLFSGILIQINNYTEAIRQIGKILEKMENLIDGNYSRKSQYNFSIFIFNSLISEKVLYLLSLIADKFELKKLKIILYINLLDLSPIYNVKLRLFILGDLYHFCFETYKKFIKRKTLRDVPEIRFNGLLYDIILARHKIRSLYFSSKTNVLKNVVLLFDLNFPILKNKHFLITFKKFFKTKPNRNLYYISFFDDHLFLFKNFQKHTLENENLDTFNFNEIKDFEFNVQKGKRTTNTNKDFKRRTSSFRFSEDLQKNLQRNNFDFSNTQINLDKNTRLINNNNIVDFRIESDRESGKADSNDDKYDKSENVESRIEESGIVDEENFYQKNISINKNDSILDDEENMPEILDEIRNDDEIYFQKRNDLQGNNSNSSIKDNDNPKACNQSKITYIILK